MRKELWDKMTCCRQNCPLGGRLSLCLHQYFTAAALRVPRDPRRATPTLAALLVPSAQPRAYPGKESRHYWKSCKSGKQFSTMDKTYFCLEWCSGRDMWLLPRFHNVASLGTGLLWRATCSPSHCGSTDASCSEGGMVSMTALRFVV